MTQDAISIFADFSCYIYIENRTGSSMERSDYGADWGYWKKGPENIIGSKKTSPEMQIADKAGELIFDVFDVS